MVSVFDYKDYKEFATDWIASAPNRGRGLRARMANAIGCQVAYVSHVLAADRHFSLEQAEALTRFMNLREDEAEYFALLVERSRAGTVSLKSFIDRQLAKRRVIYNELQNRVSSKTKFDPEVQAQYLSSWHYQAVRSLLTVPGHSSVEAIAGKLKLPISRINEVLTFLISHNLVKETEDGYKADNLDSHIGRDSAFVNRLHANWRLHTLMTLDRNNSEDLHYSSTVTLSHEDFQKVREILIKSLNEAHKVIRPSKEERLCVFAMDFYEV